MLTALLTVAGAVGPATDEAARADQIAEFDGTVDGRLSTYAASTASWSRPGRR